MCFMKCTIGNDASWWGLLIIVAHADYASLDVEKKKKSETRRELVCNFEYWLAHESSLKMRLTNSYTLNTPGTVLHYRTYRSSISDCLTCSFFRNSRGASRVFLYATLDEIATSVTPYGSCHFILRSFVLACIMISHIGNSSRVPSLGKHCNSSGYLCDVRWRKGWRGDTRRGIHGVGGWPHLRRRLLATACVGSFNSYPTLKYSNFLGMIVLRPASNRINQTSYKIRPKPQPLSARKKA